ncbi:MAG: glycosyltransferase [Pseudanabaena sp. ELA607]
MVFLSACAIVKNEAQNLPRSLGSLRPYVDELIIIDTGSTDDSILIAQQWDVIIGEFAWCDDFAAARNAALAKATGEWILMFDADEAWHIAPDGNVNFLRDFLQQQPSDISVCSILWRDAFIENHFHNGFYPRLLRRVPNLSYTGRLHEQPTHSYGIEQGAKSQPIRRNQITAVPPECYVLHYGYGEGKFLTKQKERYIPLMERIHAEEGLSLMLLHCLADAYGQVEDAAGVQRCYNWVWERISPYLLTGEKPLDIVWLPHWLYNLGIGCADSHDFDSLRIICQAGLAWFPEYPILHNLTGRWLAEQGFTIGAAAYFASCTRLCEAYAQGQQIPPGNFWEPFDYTFVKQEAENNWRYLKKLNQELN